jgi:hypothetical protein
MIKAESKVVSAYVPGLPTETASTPEPKINAEIAAVDIKPDAIIAAETKEAVVEVPVPKAVVPKLTASEILKASVEPKITLLKDISFSFKLFPGYIESKDYISFRAGKPILLHFLYYLFRLLFTIPLMS